MAHVIDNVFTSIELTGDNMAIFGNFKGTTQSEFKIGKSGGNKISVGEYPQTSDTGDLHIAAANASLKIFNGNAWASVGSTLETLNVDSGTLFVDSANDTVSVGSTSSNEKLFVNGNLRLGTNPSLQFGGAFLDLRHSNGSATNIRIRDNDTGLDPIFKVYSANNTSEVFKVQGSNTTITGDLTVSSSITVSSAYTLPTADGAADQVLVTDGNGTLSFATVNANPGGSNTQIQFNDNGSFAGSNGLTYNDSTNTLQTGVVRGVIFEPITDYGSITETATIVIDYGLVSDAKSSTGDFEFLTDTYGPTADSFSVSNLPDASQPGQMIFITDETSGPTMAFSDGTSWRRIQDRAIVS